MFTQQLTDGDTVGTLTKDFRSTFKLWGLFNWRGPEIIFLSYSHETFVALGEFIHFGLPLFVALSERAIPQSATPLAANSVYWLPMTKTMLFLKDAFGQFYFYYWFIRLLVSL